MKTVLAFFFSALFSARTLPDFIGLSLVALLQSVGVLAILMGPAARARKPARYSILAGWAVSLGVLALGFMLRFARVARLLSRLVRELGTRVGHAVGVLLRADAGGVCDFARRARASAGAQSRAQKVSGRRAGGAAGGTSRRGWLRDLRGAIPLVSTGSEHPRSRDFPRIWTDCGSCS